MTTEEIAKDMQSWHNNENLDWSEILRKIKTLTKEEIIGYVENTIHELKEMREDFIK